MNIWDNVLCSLVNRGCGQPGLKRARRREPFFTTASLFRYRFPFALAFSFLRSAERFIVSSKDFYWVNPERSGGSELCNWRGNFKKKLFLERIFNSL